MEGQAGIFTGSTIIFIIFLVSSTIWAFILGNRESRPLGSLFWVYIMAFMLGVVSALVAAIVQYLLLSMTVAVAVKFGITILTLLLIAIAGAAGRRLNKR